MARRPTQIPLDDEPVDIDLGDLPTDEELDAEAAGMGVESHDLPARGDATVMGLFQLWFTLVWVFYLLIGLAVGLTLALRGAAGIGLEALSHPGFYLIVLFWPVAVWQLVMGQL